MADEFEYANGASPGPWFPASWDGECDQCAAEYREDDLIRADGFGGWEGQNCCG